MLLTLQTAFGQRAIEDKAIRYQQERMVFKQWDRAKFEPTSGFLGLNPYYWLTWGLHPNYPDLDRRPLKPTGPQTQRLALVAAMNATDNAYKLEADTLRNTSFLEVTNFSGLVSATDPLWMLYYSKELKPVLEYSPAGLLSRLTPAVRSRVLSEGILHWYTHELDMLKERISGARAANMDRGSRILAYHRMLQEYRTLSASWSSRTATAQRSMDRSASQARLKANKVEISTWTPASDVEIAREVIRNRKF